MSYIVNGSVAPFCHSQDRPGGVPVPAFDQSAGSTDKHAFVQQQTFLGSRTAVDYSEGHAMQNMWTNRRRCHLRSYPQDSMSVMPEHLQSRIPRGESSRDTRTSTATQGAASRGGPGRPGEVAGQANGIQSVVQIEGDVQTDGRRVLRVVRPSGRRMRHLSAAATREELASRGPRSWVLLWQGRLRFLRPWIVVQPLQSRLRCIQGRRCSARRSREVLTKFGQRGYITPATRSTASTVSSSKSRGVPRDSCGKSSPRCAQGSQRCGRTVTSSRLSAEQPSRSSSSTWRTSTTCSHPYLPTAKAGGFSGDSR